MPETEKTEPEMVRVKRREKPARQWFHKGREVAAGQEVVVDRDQAKRLFKDDIVDILGDVAPAAPASAKAEKAAKAEK